MSSTNNSPKKIDPKPSSAVVNNSTQSGNVNFNVVSNRVKNQPSSLSSDSDIEIFFPEEIVLKRNSSKKSNTVISFPHQFPGRSNPFKNSEICVYSIVPTESKIVKNIVYP